MHSRIVPIFSENTVILFIEIQLIHSEHHRNILRLPLFFIGILIDHPQIPHHAPAPGIVSVMGGCQIGKAVSFPILCWPHRLCCLFFQILQNFGIVWENLSHSPAVFQFRTVSACGHTFFQRALANFAHTVAKYRFDPVNTASLTVDMFRQNGRAIYFCP